MEPATTTDPTTQPKAKKTCFVVMGFGTKPDYATGRKIDLDNSYHFLIKPAVIDAGLECIRADEIVHSGMIDVPMYEQLLTADVVVADLSTSNNNAFYELGVRHALRPFTTIIIAEDLIQIPFDENHIAVRKYKLSGEVISYDVAIAFQKMLKEAIQEIVSQDPIKHDSPIYTLLQNLTPPFLKALEAQQEAVVAAVSSAAQQEGPADDASDGIINATHSMLMAQVYKAQREGNWLQMKSVLETVRLLQKQSRQERRAHATVALSEEGVEDREDPYLLQLLALATYKDGDGKSYEADSLQAARDLLITFDPDTSNDTETLGLWGSIHKRRWALNKRTATEPIVAGSDCAKDLDAAIRAYKRGFYLRNDYYNGINYAFMLNVRSAESITTSLADAITDYVQARRVREEVISICNQWLIENPAAQPAGPLPADAKPTADRYWVLATLAEAYLGTGRDEQAMLQKAYANNPEPKMKASTEDQLARLRELLADNPLDLINPVASTTPAAA